jgi:hypothetical protein
LAKRQHGTNLAAPVVVLEMGAQDRNAGATDTSPQL